MEVGDLVVVLNPAWDRLSQYGNDRQLGEVVGNMDEHYLVRFLKDNVVWYVRVENMMRFESNEKEGG